MSVVVDSESLPVVHVTSPTYSKNLIDANIDNNGSAFNFQIFHLKVVVLGSKGCGKSSVIRSFVNLEFSDVYRPTLDLSIYHSTTVVENGRIYDLKIFDFEFLNKFPSSKQEEWDLGLINYNLMNADIYLIVFDLTSTSSFQKAQDLAYQISNQNSKAKVTLCGNKYDLYLENKDKLMMSRLTPLNLSKGSRKMAAKYNNSFNSKQKIQFETTKSKKSAPASMLHLSKNNSEKSCELLALTTKRQSRPSDLQQIAVQNSRILSQSSISVSRSCGNSPCSSPFARRFTLRTTIAGTHVFFTPLRIRGVQFTFDTMGRPSGEARVEFFTHADAQDAMNRDRRIMDGQTVLLAIHSETSDDEPIAPYPMVRKNPRDHFGPPSYLSSMASGYNNADYSSNNF
uniref:Uncharacterized protein n=1 Tax=Romanomermis culicivorax TaxID=13658 RepID=A0A915KZK2_ROMCU